MLVPILVIKVGGFYHFKLILYKLWIIFGYKVFEGQLVKQLRDSFEFVPNICTHIVWNVHSICSPESDMQTTNGIQNNTIVHIHLNIERPFQSGMSVIPELKIPHDYLHNISLDYNGLQLKNMILLIFLHSCYILSIVVTERKRLSDEWQTEIQNDDISIWYPISIQYSVCSSHLQLNWFFSAIENWNSIIESCTAFMMECVPVRMYEYRLLFEQIFSSSNDF